MGTGDVDCVNKAFKILLAEFEEPRYGEFVREEIKQFLSGSKASIGFMSEADEVVINISGENCVVKYEFWDADSGEFIAGEGVLPIDEAIKKILTSAGDNKS